MDTIDAPRTRTVIAQEIAEARDERQRILGSSRLRPADVQRVRQLDAEIADLKAEKLQAAGPLLDPGTLDRARRFYASAQGSR